MGNATHYHSWVSVKESVRKYALLICIDNEKIVHGGKDKTLSGIAFSYNFGL